jgi:tRNA pseudouridine55 synthase
MDGLLIVDKPSGPTSHDVVARMRRVLREKRIGHTGTLDPMATGVLVLVVGKATRLAKFLSASDKSYDAIVRFGIATDTADAQGRPLGPVIDGAALPREAIDAALDAFRGTFMQQPPTYSAKKIDGQRSYKVARARAGLGNAASPTDVVPAPACVTAHRIEIVSVDADTVTLRVDCSAGFYVRSLAHDLGQRLGTGAHLAALRRTRTGGFGLDRALPLHAAERDPAAAESALVPLSDVMPAWPSVVLTADGAARVGHGLDVRPIDHEPSHLRSLVDPASCGEARQSAEGTTAAALSPQPFVRLVNEQGDLLAIAEPTTAGLLHPSIVLV